LSFAVAGDAIEVGEDAVEHGGENVDLLVREKVTPALRMNKTVASPGRDGSRP
jgi:hypothetical protein